MTIRRRSWIVQLKKITRVIFLISIFSCANFSLPLLALAQAESQSADSNNNHYDALQASEILGIKNEVLRLKQLHEQGVKTGEEELTLRSLILRKILIGFLEVRRACNKTEVELAYTYDVMKREQKRNQAINEFLNLFNFAQLSVLYTLEPRSRIHKQFTQSGIMTSVSAGVGTSVSTLGVLYNKFHRTGDLSPPKFMAPLLTGGPVNGIGLSPVVDRYLDLNEQGSPISRRQEMYELWKKRYGVDMVKTPKPMAIDDGKKKKPGILPTRLLLLWSVHTFVQDFDSDLLKLLSLVRATDPNVPKSSMDLQLLGISKGAEEAAHLLRIEPQIAELIRTKNVTSDRDTRLELETELLEGVLSGMLEIRLAADKVDEELNYAFDVVLNSLLMRRGKALQLTYETNFIQNGVFGATAGWCYLNKYTKAGNIMFLISSGIGNCLSALAIMEMHGGWRKIDTGPNSLAAFLNMGEAYKFSPMISEFLNGTAPYVTNNQSRKDYLYDIWKKFTVSTLSLDSQKNREKLAAMPTVKYDSIKIVTNRISLLQSLKAGLEEFDTQLYQLVNETEASADGIASQLPDTADEGLTRSAAELARLLQVRGQLDRIRSGISGLDKLQMQMLITRRVVQAQLDVRRTVDELDKEIAIEQQALDKLNRSRDMAVAIANNANFFQINTIAFLTDGLLGLSDVKYHELYANRLNEVSGVMVGGFALASLICAQGGLRLSKTPQNMIGSAFGLENSSEATRLSPRLMTYFNSVSPESTTGMTRKSELVSYWKDARFLSTNMIKKSSIERLAANGRAHHFWSENIKTLTNRIYALYDLRAQIDTMDAGLSDLLSSAH